MSDPAKPSASAGQTYLLGSQLYLRAPQESDFARSVAVRRSPFPTSARQTETELREALAMDERARRIRLIACRTSDDEPVGLAHIDEGENWPAALVSLHAAPWPRSEEQRVKAEMLRLLAPWLMEERGAISVVVDFASDEAEPLAAADALGLRPAYIVREALWRDGVRRDQVFVQRLHPVWREKLGDPGAGIAAAAPPTAAPRAPAPLRRAASSAPLPPNTLVASERLALRPFAHRDMETIAQTFLREPEYRHEAGRTPSSPLALAQWADRMGEREPPESFSVAIVLRESGVVIGDCSLFAIDWVGRSAETGMWIYRPEHRSGGYGTEAKHLLLEYSFQRLGLHVVWSWVAEENDRSAAALLKQGYRPAGRLDWIEVGRGKFRSARLFDLLAEEWRAARR